MASASIRNSRLWWTGAVALGLVLGGWQLDSRDRALAQNAGKSQSKDEKKSDDKKTEEKKTDEKKTQPPTLTTFVTYPQVKVVNDQIAAEWKANNLTPSSRASDYEFIRRATLDIIGRIATLKEIKTFMDDPERTRRALLIERLLDMDEYAKNWANVWTVWLMTRSSNRTYQEQMQLWLEEQFAKKTCQYEKVVYDLLTATGENNENGAVNYILQNLGAPVAQKDISEEGHFDFVPLTSRTTRLFLGLRTQCTQCHDHPFNPEVKQKTFWGINAFFRQVNRTGNPMMGQQMNTPVKLGLEDDNSVNPDPKAWYDPRNMAGRWQKAEFLEKDKKGNPQRWNPAAKGTRREQLAEYVTKSNYFPKAYVNRMWGHFFGRGFTNPGPVDDFGEHNPVTHPMLPNELVAKLMKMSGPIPDELAKEVKKCDEDKDNDRLLDYLAKEFKNYGNNPRDLIRWICNSEAYSLSSVANKTNEKADTEPFFSRMLLKAMSPEQLFESLMTATQAEQAETKDAKKKLREDWMKNLIVNFGDDEGNEVTFNGTVVQALMLMNGKEINDAISNPNKGTVATICHAHGRNQAKTLDLLYMTALNRLPTSREYSLIAARSKIAGAGDLKNPLAPWQDLFWALVNSNEFILNH